MDYKVGINYYNNQEGYLNINYNLRLSFRSIIMVDLRIVMAFMQQAIMEFP